MHSINYNGKTYTTDHLGYINDFKQWDEGFPEGMAIGVRIANKLTKEHWDIIRHIREEYVKNKSCPNVYETCHAIGIGLNELKQLFPTGYQRGACKLAGITYGEIPSSAARLFDPESGSAIAIDGSEYPVNAFGFLNDPAKWDERFARYLAQKAKIPGGKLTEKHWEVISYLRKIYSEREIVPTIYETCDALRMDIDELESLFPDGYHSGAIKLAGLRIR